MKYLSILRFINHYLKAVGGKLLGFILTPLIFPHRDWIRNYNYNYMQINKLPLKRSTIHSEDDEKYYAKNGWIVKRKTNLVLGKIVMFLWRFLDDDSNLTSCSTMFVKPENVKGLVHIGSYFDIGDKQRENKISIWTNWQNFKDFYYWMVIRNGFYNYNYYDEDSIMNECGAFDLPEDKRMHKKGPNKEEFSIHHFFQDENGKWFFRTAMCKHYKGFAYGYEIGWYRTSSGGVNAKIRLEWKKPIEKIQN
jgi:hypothetical protein